MNSFDRFFLWTFLLVTLNGSLQDSLKNAWSCEIQPIFYEKCKNHTKSGITNRKEVWCRQDSWSDYGRWGQSCFQHKLESGSSVSLPNWTELVRFCLADMTSPRPKWKSWKSVVCSQKRRMHDVFWCDAEPYMIKNYNLPKKCIKIIWRKKFRTLDEKIARYTKGVFKRIYDHGKLDTEIGCCKQIKYSVWRSRKVKFKEERIWKDSFLTEDITKTKMGIFWWENEVWAKVCKQR